MGGLLSAHKKLSLKRKLRRGCPKWPRKQRFPFQQLPYEIQVMIFAFLDTDQLWQCRRVCVLWHDLVYSITLWRMKCSADNIVVPQFGHESSVVLDYRLIYIKQPYDRNLIKNWNAVDGLSGWTIHTDSGDHFSTEEDIPSGADSLLTTGHSDCNHCWVTSYGWCCKGQMIDLCREGGQPEVLDQLQPPIAVSVWTAARRDCTTLYVLDVKLCSVKFETLHTFTYEHPVNQQHLLDKGGKWIQVCHTFDNYGSGVRYVEFRHGGMDMQYWAGHYGPKMAAPCVKILPSYI